MKVTNYSKIANKYEKNEYRHKISHDKDLEKYILQTNQDHYNVLDLACGTGLYLYNQIEYFKDNNINWFGLDASNDMLKLAKAKVRNASLLHGYAESQPYEDQFFDYIVNNYAFQHFTKKTESLDEVTRVLKKGGIFKMHNIAIHDMKKWWLYQYFPSAYFEDLKRFWDKELIFHELSKRGFEVEIQIQYSMVSKKLSELIDYAENRDISVLTLIDDKEYQVGLDTMKSELNNNIHAKLDCDFAEMFCIAKKL